jgi:hypothetical protein
MVIIMLSCVTKFSLLWHLLFSCIRGREICSLRDHMTPEMRQCSNIGQTHHLVTSSITVKSSTSFICLFLETQIAWRRVSPPLIYRFTFGSKK